MSLPQTSTLNCPGCGYSQSTTIWNSVNASIDPKLKKKLLRGKLNVFHCRRCGKETQVASNLLYHDMDSRLMIWLRYPDEHGNVSVDDTADGLLQLITPDYTLRLVTSRNQLIEKLHIFDSKLDDRAIEITKIGVFQSLPPDSCPSEDRIFFQKLHRSLFRPSELLFVLFDPSFDTSRDLFVKHSVYSGICDMIPSSATERSKDKSDWLLVDRAYAAQLAARSLPPMQSTKEPWPEEPKPDGTVMWRDDMGQVHEEQFPKSLVDDVLKAGGAKRVYRILIKDPFSKNIEEDYWELTPEQARKFADSQGTAYCIVTYDKGEKQCHLVVKDLWLTIPGWSG